jgi:hypothetical protein
MLSEHVVVYVKYQGTHQNGDRLSPRPKLLECRRSVGQALLFFPPLFFFFPESFTSCFFCVSIYLGPVKPCFLHRHTHTHTLTRTYCSSLDQRA